MGRLHCFPLGTQYYKEMCRMHFHHSNSLVHIDYMRYPQNIPLWLGSQRSFYMVCHNFSHLPLRRHNIHSFDTEQSQSHHNSPCHSDNRLFLQMDKDTYILKNRRRNSHKNCLIHMHWQICCDSMFLVQGFGLKYVLIKRNKKFKTKFMNIPFRIRPSWTAPVTPSCICLCDSTKSLILTVAGVNIAVAKET